MRKKPLFADLSGQEEDERIDIIGNMVMHRGLVVAFATETTKDKMDRYLDKLRTRFHGIVVLERFKGPVEGTETAKVGPPAVDDSIASVN